MMSACGVLCSECPAYHARTKGPAHQQRVADAWRAIYGLDEKAANISCGGCPGPDAELFHTSRTCAARRCCRSSGHRSCAECAVERCADLEKALAVWDGVPAIGRTLSEPDFVAYARASCGHRERLAAARAAARNRR